MPRTELLTLAASAERTTDGTGDAVYISEYRRYLVQADVTALATAAGDTLDVYVDMSIDGTNWFNAAHFTQAAGNDTAFTEIAVIDSTTPGTATIDITTDAAAGAVVPQAFGRQMRARWVIVDAGAAAQAFTFSVSCLASE